MAVDTKIAWARSTYNPWIGCTEVSPGCDNCYARLLDSRKRWGAAAHWGSGVPRYRGSQSGRAQVRRWDAQAALEQQTGVLTARSRWGGRVGFWPVFCASLGDVLDNEVPTEWAFHLFELIEQTPHLSWLLVTKRIGIGRVRFPPHWLSAGFPAHVRVLISVVNQEEADRDIPKLLALPCKNGISYEPALGPIVWGSGGSNYDGWDWLRGHRQEADAGDAAGVGAGVPVADTRRIEWIIVGGESGRAARSFDLGWARSTVQQCRAAGVPVFVKQLGCNFIDSLDRLGRGVRVVSNNAFTDPAAWPVDLRVQEFPKDR